MIFLKITPELTCDKICHMINKLIAENTESHNKILIIDLKSISYDDDNLIPKLEFKAK